MKKLIFALGILLLCAPVHADDGDDGSSGLTAAMLNRWNEAQIQYSRVLNKFGKGSPEATEAEVLMNTTARELGIKPSGEVPETAKIVEEETPKPQKLLPIEEISRQPAEPPAEDPPPVAENPVFLPVQDAPAVQP